MEDRMRLVLVVVVTALVIATSLVFLKEVSLKGEATKMTLPGLILVVVVLLMIPFVKRRYFDVKKGFPYEDERSKKIMTRAMANAYLISLYWLLAIGWASDSIIEFRDVSQAMGAGILGMAIIFGLCYLYVNNKGDVE